MWILSFLLGALVGSCITLYVIFKSLTTVDPGSSRKELGGIDLDTGSKKCETKVPDTSLFDAFKKVDSADAGSSVPGKSEKDDTECAVTRPDYANMSPVELEKVYSNELKIFRENQKQMKLFHTFFMELSKSFSTQAKDLSRLSHVAHNNLTKLVNGAQSGEAETLAVYMESLSQDDASSYVDIWWKSLSISMDHLAHDTEVLAVKLSAEIGFEIQRLSEEFLLIEKKLFEDGSRYLAQLKECNATYDTKIKEKCKYQERLEKLMLLPNQGGSEAARIQTKINACDAGLQESAHSLNIVTSHFVSAMPRIISSIDIYNLKSRSILSSKLIQFVDTCAVYDSKMTQVFQRLREDCMAVSRSTTAKDINMILSGHVDASTALQLDDIRKLFKEASATDARLMAEADAPMVDMASVAMAALAASSPLDVKAQLKASTEVLLPVIGAETCVWLNAFTGRIYRDISKSKEFHIWLCALVGRLLNKAPKRPDYIEEFKIESVEFGGLPPIIRNVKWIPGDSAPRADTNTTRSRSGTTSGSSEGEDGKAADSPQIPGTAKNMKAYDLNSFPYNADFDVNCEGDMTFRSGVQFSVSTKIWINWPKEKYASIPVLLKLNMEEVAGRIRFGVIKNSCCFSFLEMPYTRFRVVSEVGDQYKIKNLPKLSDMIIKQIRKVMFNRMVYPHAHTFKLVWPRHWWPKGTRDDWPHQGPQFSTDGVATAAAVEKPEEASEVKATQPTGAAHTSSLSILSKNSSGAATTSTCAPITDSCTPGVDSSSTPAAAATATDKPVEKKGGFRSAISSFFHSTKSTSPSRSALQAVQPAAAATVKAVPVKTANAVPVKAAVVSAVASSTAATTDAVKTTSTKEGIPAADSNATASGSGDTVPTVAAIPMAKSPTRAGSSQVGSVRSSPKKALGGGVGGGAAVSTEKKSVSVAEEHSVLAAPASVEKASSKPDAEPASSASASTVARRLSAGKQGSLDDIGLQTTDAEERERDRKGSPRNVANDDTTGAEDIKTTPIRRRLSHMLPETSAAAAAAPPLGVDMLTQKPIAIAPPETFVTVQVEEFPKEAGSGTSASSAQVDQSFELTPDKSTAEPGSGPLPAAEPVITKKRTSSFSGLAALLGGAPAHSTVPPIAPAPAPAPGTDPAAASGADMLSAQSGGDILSAQSTAEGGDEPNTESSFNSNGDAGENKGREEEGAAGTSRWRQVLQAGKERILHGKGAAATPAGTTGTSGSADSTPSSPAVLPVPVAKPDELLSAYVSIPPPGTQFSETKAASLKKYFIVLRKQKLLIYNNADEYNKSTGNSGTRASYTLLGAMCRPTSETESGFEIWFSATSSYNKGKKAGDPDKWLTFWAASETESKQWILSIMAQSEPS